MVPVGEGDKDPSQAVAETVATEIVSLEPGESHQRWGQGGFDSENQKRTHADVSGLHGPGSVRGAFPVLADDLVRREPPALPSDRRAN